MNLYYTKYFDLGTVMPAVFPEMSDGSGPQDESILWVEEAKKRGIKKILVTHPDHFFIQMPAKVQQELAKKGIFFDRCSPTRTTSPLTMEGMAERIREVGAASSVLTSDFGQPQNPFPVEGLKNCIRQFIQLCFSDQEIDQRVRINPSRLLNLS